MSMDIFPTLLEAADVDIAHDIEGVSFLPTLLGRRQAELRTDWFFSRREGGTRYGGKTIEAVRRGDWKLLQNSPMAPFELYNLADDPMEQNNLATRSRKAYGDLAAGLRAHMQRGGAVAWQKPMP